MVWEQDQDEHCEDPKEFVKDAERRINKLKAEGLGRVQAAPRDYRKVRSLSHSPGLVRLSTSR